MCRSRHRNGSGHIWVRLASAVAMVVLTAGSAGAAADEASRLSWLAGCWTGGTGGQVSEEHWTSAAGGALIGMNKAVAQGKLVSYEFLRIERQGERLCYLASPGGAPPTPFCAVEVGDSKVVFENREHDFPQRVLYWRDGATLHARIEGTLGGRPESDEWVWSRCAESR